MATQKMDAKKIVIGVMVLGFLVWSSVAGVRVSKQKKQVQSQWSQVAEASREISNLLPNFIYVAKTSAVQANSLMTEIAKARLIYEEQKQKQKSWNADILPAIDQLIQLQAQLMTEIEKTPKKPAMKAHLAALQQQWKIRQDVYENSQSKFKTELAKYRHMKYSFAGYPTLIWDRD